MTNLSETHCYPWQISDAALHPNAAHLSLSLSERQEAEEAARKRRAQEKRSRFLQAAGPLPSARLPDRCVCLCVCVFE